MTRTQSFPTCPPLVQSDCFGQGDPHSQMHESISCITHSDLTHAADGRQMHCTDLVQPSLGREQPPLVSRPYIHAIAHDFSPKAAVASSLSTSPAGPQGIEFKICLHYWHLGH